MKNIVFTVGIKGSFAGEFNQDDAVKFLSQDYPSLSLLEFIKEKYKEPASAINNGEINVEPEILSSMEGFIADFLLKNENNWESAAVMDQHAEKYLCNDRSELDLINLISASYMLEDLRSLAPTVLLYSRSDVPVQIYEGYYQINQEGEGKLYQGNIGIREDIRLPKVAFYLLLKYKDVRFSTILGKCVLSILNRNYIF